MAFRNPASRPKRRMQGAEDIAKLQVFISHNKNDEEIAKRLITLIRSAFNLPAAAIRCTSVNGYMLPIGISVEERLRLEIEAAGVFIALLTPHSLKSAWVLVELGARWGTGKHFFPLLSCVDPDHVQMGPFSGFSSVNCGDEAQMYQFIDELGKSLSRKPESASVFRKCILELAESSQPERAAPPGAGNALPDNAASGVKLGSPPAHTSSVIRGEIYSSPKWGSSWIVLSSPRDFFRGDRLLFTLGGPRNAKEKPAERVLVRLLENGDDPNGPTGIITPTGISVPDNRVFDVTVPANFQNVGHISVHGGDTAWNYFLGQGNGPAALIRVELITAAK